MEEMTRQDKCRYAYINLKSISDDDAYLCLKQDQKAVTCEECNLCQMFNSRFIEYPIQVNEIKQNPIEYSNGLHASYVGKPVAVRVKDKTYLGIFIGDLPSRTHISYMAQTGRLSVNVVDNPAMFVPELNRIVFGYESWWKVLESEEDFKDITDSDINNTWYVQMLKLINKKEN